MTAPNAWRGRSFSRSNLVAASAANGAATANLITTIVVSIRDPAMVWPYIGAALLCLGVAFIFALRVWR